MLQYQIIDPVTGNVLSDDWYLSQDGNEVVYLTQDYSGTEYIIRYDASEFIIKFAASNDNW